MIISNANALHIATYLSKGIFNNPSNKDVNISIGENTCIGIERRGHKYILYIQYAEQRNKADMRTGFNENISLDALAGNIKILIEGSETIKDIELNMQKVPMLPAEDFQVVTGSAGKSSEAPLKKPSIKQFVPETTIPTETLLPKESFQTPSSPVEISMENDAAIEIQPQAEDPKPENANEEEINGADDDSLYDQYSELTGPPVMADDSLPTDKEENNDEELEEYPMAGAENTVNNKNKLESALNAAGLLPAQVDNKDLPEMSYISQIIGDDNDIKQKLCKAIDQLVIRDRESAVEFYIKMLYRLLPLFGNDIDSAHTGTDIDKRDFMLSVYEIQLFS